MIESSGASALPPILFGDRLAVLFSGAVIADLLHIEPPKDCFYNAWAEFSRSIFNLRRLMNLL